MKVEVTASALELRAIFLEGIVKTGEVLEVETDRYGDFTFHREWRLGMQKWMINERLVKEIV